MYKEQKIASFQQGKNKLQLLEITTTEPSNIQVFELYHCQNGWKYECIDGRICNINEEEVEQFAKICQLTKINESYYYLEENKKTIYNYKKYQVRLNRKRISTSISEYEMRKLFATYVQNIVLQLKIF